MQFYNAAAPSPRRVRIFLAEKGVELPRVDLDLPGGETYSAAFLQKNSLGQVPVLETDDGSFITESQSICRYIEALHPEPSLFGQDPLERARIDMWDRRMENEIFNALGRIAQHSFAHFKDKLTQVPAFAEAQRADMAGKFAWLDAELSDGRPYIAGERFTVADITGMGAAMIADFLDVAIPETCSHLQRWNEKVRARPSWSA